MGVTQWLDEIATVYGASDREDLENRLARWQGTADRTVLTYGVWMELRALRTLLQEQMNRDKGAVCHESACRDVLHD